MGEGDVLAYLVMMASRITSRYNGRYPRFAGVAAADRQPLDRRKEYS